MVPVPNADLLAELEDAVVVHRPEAPDLFRPGLSPARLDELAAAAGVPLSVEARAWWTWHDGSAGGALPGVEHLSFEAAFDQYRRWREMAAKFGPGWLGADAMWHPAWVPMFDTGVDTFAIDCSGALDAPSPLRRVDWETNSQETITYPSMGACVVDIIEALRERLTYYHALKRWTGR
jgi:cell wall assembly regulator SMI1